MSEIVTGPTESYVQDEYGRQLRFKHDSVESPVVRLKVSTAAPADAVEGAGGTPGQPGDLIFVPSDAAVYVCVEPADETSTGAWRKIALAALGA